MEEDAERMNNSINTLNSWNISQQRDIDELKKNMNEINAKGWAGGSKKRARGTVRKKKNIKKK